MKIHKRVVGIIAALSVVISSIGTSNIITKAKVSSSENKSEYIIEIDNQKTCNDIYEDYSKKDSVTENLKENKVIVAELTSDEVQEIKNNDNVLSVEKDSEVCASVAEEEKQSYITQKAEYPWNIQSINANESQDFKDKGKVKIGVIDSGIDAMDNSNVVEHINFVEEESSIAPLYEDGTGHGTSIAGIITGNDKQIKGINENAQLYSLKVLDKNNKSTVSRIVKAIYWCIDNDMDIINMSFGTNTNSPALYEAIKEADNKGILMVASSGNDKDIVQYPAKYDEVIAVGSVDGQNQVSDFSGKGEEVEVVAPGEKVETSGGFGGYIVASGTSMAVPHVVGIASILLEKDKTADSGFIRTLIDESARKLKDEGSGNGKTDLEYALSIYDKVKSSYVKGEEVSIENNNRMECYDTDECVNGQWAGVAHEISVDKGYDMSDIDKLDYMIDVSLIRGYIATADIKVFKGYASLHCGYNYVANLRYLFNTAKRIKSGKTVEAAISATTYSDISYYNNNKDYPIHGSDVNKQLDAAIREITKNGNTNGQKCQLVLALAFHLAGDIYAHQSLVPTSAITLTSTKGNSLAENQIVTENFFNLKHFTAARYKEIVDAVKNTGSYLKFFEITKKQKKEDGSYYEDNLKFYSSRFNRATCWAVAAMLDDMYNYNEYFSAWTLTPELYVKGGYTIKRYRVYPYVVRCGLPIDDEEKACLKSKSMG